MSSSRSAIEDVYSQVLARNPGEPEFHQAVHEVLRVARPRARAHPRTSRRRSSSGSVEPERADHLPRAVGRRRRATPGQPRLPRRRTTARSAPTRAACASTRRSTSACSSSSASSRSSRTRSPACRWAAARAARLRSQGQVRRRGHALLPVVHDRALPPHRRGHRRAGRRHRRRRPRDRLHVRPVQAHHQPVQRACSPARASSGAAR